VGVSFTPEVWEKLTDLRVRHQRLAEQADRLRRMMAAGEATREECERAERREREAYSAWRLARTGELGVRTVDPDHEVEEVPRDS
jgi:hypothetical protein